MLRDALAASAVLCCLAVVPADAQEPAADVQPAAGRSQHAGAVPVDTLTSFPGSFWTGSGLMSPLERGNLVTVYAFEQGLTLVKRGRHALVPYAGLVINVDRQGFDWNNKAVSGAGVKYAVTFANGIVQVGAGYAHEHRLRSGAGLGGAIGFANYWFGWSGDRKNAASRTLLSSLPGSSWAAVGNQAPAEGTNVIATVHVQQGVTAVRIGRASVIPFVESTLTVDAAGHSWNNRRVLGEGVKLRIPLGGGTLEAAAVYKHERRWRDGQSAGGVAGWVNFWYGWNPARAER